MSVPLPSVCPYPTQGLMPPWPVPGVPLQPGLMPMCTAPPGAGSVWPPGAAAAGAAASTRPRTRPHSGRQAVGCPTPAPEMESRPAPCAHNDWDDVRQRKGVKMLRCRVCNTQWKWAKGARRGDVGFERCIDFLYDRCPKGSACALLHIRRKKVPLADRVEVFGDTVLDGVPLEERMRFVTETPRSSDGPHSPSKRAAASEVASAVPSSGPTESDSADMQGLRRLAKELSLHVLGGEGGGHGHSASGPPTPRGTAPTFHKRGPPLPANSRRRAHTPPPAERRTDAAEVRPQLVPVLSPQVRMMAESNAELLLGMAICEEVCWEVLPDHNNTIGMVPRPRTSTHVIKYIGTFASFEEARAAAERHRVYSFTWHGPRYQKAQWRLQCYGQVSPLFNSANGLVGQMYNPTLDFGVVTARLSVRGECVYRQVGCFGLVTELGCIGEEEAAI